MDRMSDSGSDGCGSIPHGVTNHTTICCTAVFLTFWQLDSINFITFSIVFCTLFTPFVYICDGFV